MVKLERFGLWWKKHEDRYESDNPCIIVSKEDFPQLEEAQELYCKFSELARYCIRTGKQVYKATEKFYVLLDTSGGIRLPRDKDCKRIRTLDSSLIPGFEIAESHI